MLESTSAATPVPTFRPRFDPTPLADEVPVIATARTSVRELLERYGIAPRKRFGQNFLHDPAVARRIVEAAGVGPGDRVVEIGPGLGALTGPLLDTGARVTAIEVDRRLSDCLEERLGAREGLRLVRGDALALDLREILEPGTILVANLPYSITGPLLDRLVVHADRLDRAVIMVQREVGDRILAGAGGRGIGAPAVFLRLLYDVEKLFPVGRGAFLPPPEIVSVVIRLRRRSGAILDPSLRAAVNLAYRQRRKMLRKTLKETVAEERVLAESLEELGKPAAARPEELAPEDWPLLLAAAARRSAGGEGEP